MGTVATPVPRLYADKGRILAGRRPQPYQRCVETQAQARATLRVIQGNLLHLAVLQYQGIVVKRVYIQRQQPVLVQRQRIAALHVGTTFFGNQDVLQILRRPETEIAAQLVSRLIVREVKCRMRPYLEVHRPVARIAYFPKHIDAVAVDAVPDVQQERERIFGPCFLRVLQPVMHFVGRFGVQPEIHVPGKTVLRKLESLSLVAVLPLPHAAHNGEQHRRMAFPVSRVGLPQILASPETDAAQFSPVRSHPDGKFRIRKCFHKLILF